MATDGDGATVSYDANGNGKSRFTPRHVERQVVVGAVVPGRIGRRRCRDKDTYYTLIVRRGKSAPGVDGNVRK